MKKKITAVALVVALLAVAIVGGTLAYFTDETDEKVNTFTIGKVDIDLTETSKADEDNGIKAGEETDNGFDYTNVVPGGKYSKAPVITVVEDTDGRNQPAWVFAELTISNYAELRAMIDAANKDEYKDENLAGDALDEVFLPDNHLGEFTIVGSWMDDDGVAHLVYLLNNDTTDPSDEGIPVGTEIPLFDVVEIPAKLDKSLALITNPVDLDIKAYGIQYENVADAETAFGQFFPEQDYIG